jgi:hypothetical protein
MGRITTAASHRQAPEPDKGMKKAPLRGLLNIAPEGLASGQCDQTRAAIA